MMEQLVRLSLKGAGRVPEGLKLGDALLIECAQARVIELSTDLVDVTPIQGPEQFVPGQATVGLLLTNIIVRKP